MRQRESDAKVPGAGEWLTLSRLFAYAGDTTLMPDAQGNRMLVIAPDGSPVRSVASIVRTPGSGRATFRISGGNFLDARFIDSRGRLYYQESFVFGGPNVSRTAPALDTSPVVRFDVRTQRTDTVTYVRLPARGASTTSSMRGRTASMSAVLPYAPLDVWAALPDGRVVIARPTDYHVELVSPNGARTVGPGVQYTPIRVTAAEKKAFIDLQKGSRERQLTTTNGNRVAPPPPPEPTLWPATIPPFLAGAAYTTPSGETWILRTRPLADLVPSFDVFDDEGRNIARVVLPTRTSIAGFGARSLYLLRTDDNGLQYLQRYAMQ